MNAECYLLTDSDFLSCYLVSKWLQCFGNTTYLKGIAIAEDRPSEELILQRKSFHQKYRHCTEATADILDEIADLYPTVDDGKLDRKLNQASIRLLGMPTHSTIDGENTFFLGKKLNGPRAKAWLAERCNDTNPFIFIGVTQILKPWWIEMTQSRLLNCHPAVLPYARGLFPIENIAALKDEKAFREATGASVHFVDSGVDTGPILAVERIANPFRFNSIWELKAYTLKVLDNLYIDVAKKLMSNSDTLPVAVPPDPSLTQFIFRRKAFTPLRQKQAEEGYLAMKKSVETRATSPAQT